LFHEPRYALLPSSNPLAEAPRLRLSDLVGEPFASAPGACATWRSFWGAAEGRTGPFRVGVEVTTVNETLFAVAYHGIAVTFPSSAVRRYPLPGLKAVPLVDAEPGETAVAARAGESRPAVLAFRQIAREVARQHIGCVPDAVLAGDPPG
jgi:DNA-binding transcriptional LysR family regulator